jgi:hypothetical protein
MVCLQSSLYWRNSKWPMDPLSNPPGSSMRPTRLKPVSLGLDQTGDDKHKMLGIIYAECAPGAVIVISAAHALGIQTGLERGLRIESQDYYPKDEGVGKLEMRIRGVLRMTAVLALLLVAGCGSGGSGGGSQSAAGLASGQIIDSLIQGLDYRSNSKSGLTDAQGTFSHGAGETVTFSIGNLDLGTTPGKPIATVVDLVEGATGVNNQRVTNIARFLQSLDSDCNVRNGIQITSQIRAEVSPRVIDFDQSSIAFGSDPVIADLFNRLNTAGAFTGGCVGTLRPEAVAREHLTKSINDTWVLAGGSIDFDGDGVDDATKRIVRDGRGRVTELVDFLFDCIVYWEYDDTDHSVLVRRDDGRDGTIDYIAVLRYDAVGNLIEEEYDDNADGVFDEIDVYQRDVFGRETGRFWQRYDTGQTYRYRTVYDADGNVILEQTDSGDDGTIDYEYRYTYVGGKLTRHEYIYSTGGSTHLYTYAGDNLISETSDWENDGIFDWRSDYTYDAKGNRLTTKQYTFKNVAGVFTWFLDYEETFVFNQNDLYIEQILVFHYSGGNPDETHRQVVTRDANGNITRTEWTKPTGAIEIQTFIWEEQSIPTEFDIYIPAAGPLAFS